MNSEQMKDALAKIDAAITASFSADHDGCGALLALEEIKKVLIKSVGAQEPGNCKVCGAKLYRARFKGYYDTFDYWDCNCGDDVPVEHEFHGGYS